MHRVDKCNTPGWCDHGSNFTNMPERDASWEAYDHVGPGNEARGGARKPDSGSELYVHSWLAARGG